MQGITQLIAGDSLDFTTSVADYPATEGWTLVYRLVPRFATPVQTPIELTAATHEVTGYRVTVAPSTTAGWAAGAYGWGSWVAKTGQRVTLERGGELTIAPDPATIAQGVDTRSAAAIALAAIKALILGKATSGQESYRINGRELRSYPLPDLLALQREYQAEVAREQRAAAAAAGQAPQNRFGIRLARV
jgi:hypothetical protein